MLLVSDKFLNAIILSRPHFREEEEEEFLTEFEQTGTFVYCAMYWFDQKVCV